MTAEGIDTFEADIIAMRNQAALLGWIADRSLRQREVHRAVVVQDQKSILPPDHRMLQRVFDAFAARQDDGELCVRVSGVRVTDLRGDRGPDAIITYASLRVSPTPSQNRSSASWYTNSEGSPEPSRYRHTLSGRWAASKVW